MTKDEKDYVKNRTSELYDSLPMDLEQRKACTDVRDEILKLNYKFFGYIAANTYVENVSYEDKFQTALLSFLGMWWKYKWTPKYRADLSFGVFFKPRISEEIKRFLSPVSYTVKRGLCMKVAEQLNKPWSEVRYEDLERVNLSNKEMISLKAVLGASYPADLSEYELYLESPEFTHDIDYYITDEYDTIEELLIQEMIAEESALSDKKLKSMAELYGLSYDELKQTLPQAMKTLYKRLKDNQ